MAASSQRTDPRPMFPDPRAYGLVPPAQPRLSSTVLLIALALLAYAGAAMLAGAWWAIPPEALQALGGNLAALTLTGDDWRLASNLFLHAGLLHLGLNLYMLFLVGRLAERWFGQGGTLAIYLVGGLWASYASACWLGAHTMPDAGLAALGRAVGRDAPLQLVVSVGASGAIMALCGAVLAMVLRHGETPPLLAREGWVSRGSGKSLALVTGINVVAGFLIPGVDQGAHLGGLVAGAVLALAAGAAQRPERAGWWPGVRPVVVAAVACALLYVALRELHWPALMALRADVAVPALR